MHVLHDTADIAWDISPRKTETTPMISENSGGTWKFSNAPNMSIKLLTSKNQSDKQKLLRNLSLCTEQSVACWEKVIEHIHSTYPRAGCTTIALGSSSPVLISSRRLVPLKSDTSIMSVPVSVQYSFLLTQSTAIPSGVSKSIFIRTSTLGFSSILARLIVSLTTSVQNMYPLSKS